MIRLPETLQAWDSPACRDTLRLELERLDSAALPLQQGLSYTSHALNEFSVRVLQTESTQERLKARVGIIYAGIIPGCSCADDPTPIEPQAEYCEILVEIDRISAEARISLAPD